MASGCRRQFRGGGASGVTAGLTAMGLDPEKFNTGAGLGNSVKMMLAVFVVSGLIKFFFYLQQNPTPAWDGADRRNGNGQSK